jgi:hypothetical protein
MISSEVIKGVQELLKERGVHKKSDENLGDFVARELRISDHQAQMLLESLHDGHTVEEAVQSAGIDPTAGKDLLIQIARAFGTAVGKLST